MLGVVDGAEVQQVKCGGLSEAGVNGSYVDRSSRDATAAQMETM